MKRLNLTQHPATPEQIADGVEDLSGDTRERLIRLLTFTEKPEPEEIERRAMRIAEMARSRFWHGDDPTLNFSLEWGSAMIGGAPYLMAPLERALRDVGIHPEYSFSVRESVEITHQDGRVEKRTVFKHSGWILACED